MPGYENFVTALETCFDFHSARVVAREAANEAGLDDHAEWAATDLERALAHVPAEGKDLGPALERLALAAPDDDAPADVAKGPRHRRGRKQSASTPAATEQSEG